ncbi:MAG: farnesyl-diphosphate synthase [Proteobacteria bacterium]|jgi:farnesyl diphosphate synthase|nr:MAG: farnesyl-diphosphate synthase [Pseudomonadota bacterium]
MTVGTKVGGEAALNEVARLVERRMEKLLPVAEGHEARLADAVKYAVLAGGKRLRPFLVVASADLFGVARDCSLRVAAAVEFVHTYSLIHDDLPCMDDADTRRGKPTVHKIFDEATAVLAGDALLTYAFEILAEEATHSDPRVRLELVRSLAVAGGFHGMVGGQMIDLVAETEAMDLSAITRLQQMKTGALMGFSVEAGAILGRAPMDKRHALRGYARDMGLAFQIADDLLDIEGDAATLGKDTGKDQAAGKATFVTALGVERARTQAEILTNQAIEYLDVFGSAAELLRDVARFAIKRNK